MTRFLEKLSENLRKPIRIKNNNEINLNVKEEKTYENIQRFFSSDEGKVLIPKNIKDM